MINVLQNWQEIGEATMGLGRCGLPKHASGEKCWDLYKLHEIVDPLPRSAKVIDLGCSGVCTLKLLHTMGFDSLFGVDLKPQLTDRISQLSRMWRGRTLNRPFRIHKRDLTRTGFPADRFDVATCISVIEHGVDLSAFLQEASRILMPGGLLYVTADYWEDKIDVSDCAGEFGLPWKIFSKDEIEHFLELAGQFGFSPSQNANIPACSQKCIVWQQKEYTFISLALMKRQRP